MKTGYAEVNGLSIYYEIHGRGRPLIFLHGSFMSIHSSRSVIKALARSRKVIAIDMQGHGRTRDNGRRFTFKNFADDAAGVLRYLKIRHADIAGFSLGASVALKTAIDHPRMIRNVVVISGVYKFNGWIPELRKATASVTPEFFKGSSMEKEYQMLAPEPERWPEFVRKLTKFDSTRFDFGKTNLKKLKGGVLIISGDNDGVDTHHLAEMYQACGGNIFADVGELPKARLNILPATTHVGLLKRGKDLKAIIDDFM